MADAAPNPEKILQTGLAFWSSKALLSAVELDLFTHLAEQPGNVEDLQKRLGLHPRAARDFLDTLVALGFLERAEGVYRNAADTDTFLDKRKPSYIGGILEMANHRLFRSWRHLTEAVQTGEMQSESKGADDFFAKMYADPERLREFLRAMSGMSRGANMAIARKLNWANYSTFVDVGTAQGDLAVQIALANPQITGLGFDLPTVEPIFNEYVAENDLADRVEFAPGDFFKDDLPKADVVLMGHILHDWDLDQKRQLCAKAYAALPEGGAFVAYDSIIDNDRRENAFGLLMSLNMLIETPGGFDYTAADCESWMRNAGFRETYFEHLAGPESMVVGIK